MITTARADLTLQWLEERHSDALYELLQENRTHLTAHGDYQEQVLASPDAIRSELSAANTLRFGIFINEDLAGRIDLVPVDPPRYGLGYWLAKSFAGMGYATDALAALLDHAAVELGASDIYAGVTHGNGPSQALLRRAGFVAIERFETYTRFHRALPGPSSIQD